jgi:hypothetical protein
VNDFPLKHIVPHNCAIAAIAVSIALLLVVMTSPALAQQAPKGIQNAGASDPQTSPPQDAEISEKQETQPEKQAQSSVATGLKVAFEPHETQLTPGRGIDVVLELRNESPGTLFVDTMGSLLLFPSAISDGESIGRSCMFFPQLDLGGSQTTNSPTADKWLRLNSGDETRVYCNVPKTSGSVSAVQQPEHVQQPEQAMPSFWDQFIFTPGDYRVSAIVRYTDDTMAPSRHRIATSTNIFPVVATQTVKLTGAMVGGLFAFFLFQFWSGLSRLRQIGRLFSTVLLSVVVTILISRLSDTQFFIKVSVNDIWGAIAVGVVAAYGGRPLIEKLISHDSSSGKTDISKNPPSDPAKAILEDHPKPTTEDRQKTATDAIL